MLYHDRRQIQGSPQVALRTIRDSLVANGFKITALRDDSFEAAGPGVHSSRQNPIRGISRATVSTYGSTLETRAELGGLSRFGWLIMLLPLGFIVLGVIGLLLRSAPADGARPSLTGWFLALLPLLIVMPAILQGMRKRTIRAIEALIESAARIAAAG